MKATKFDVRLATVNLTHDKSISEDCLRYDRGFVSDLMPNVVIFPTLRDKDGTFVGKPTEARWKSFQTDLTGYSKPQAAEIVEHMKNNTNDWYTFRRPKGNTSDLKKFTFRQVLDAQRLSELE